MPRLGGMLIQKNTVGGHDGEGYSPQIFPGYHQQYLGGLQENVAWEREFFHGLDIQMVMGHNYLGVFQGEAADQRDWVEVKVQGWASDVYTLAGVVLHNPHKVYYGMKKSLYQEWKFLK